MENLELREDELSLRAAGADIKTAVRTGQIELWQHAREEMKNDGFDMQDLHNAIRMGQVLSAEEKQTKFGRVIRYRLVGETADPDARQSMAVIFEVPQEAPVPVVTVFAVRGNRRH